MSSVSSPDALSPIIVNISPSDNNETTKYRKTYGPFSPRGESPIYYDDDVPRLELPSPQKTGQSAASAREYTPIDPASVGCWNGFFRRFTST